MNKKYKAGKNLQKFSHVPQNNKSLSSQSVQDFVVLFFFATVAVKNARSCFGFSFQNLLAEILGLLCGKLFELAQLSKIICW